jgi:thiol-disulfide isomerase/thioredoxin
MRSPAEIHAPPIPHDLPWVNVASLRMDKQVGRPVLVEFFDFCRVHSLRTLPYVKAWHERYADAGLRVISVHCPGYEASRDEDEVRAAVERLGIKHPVCLDHRFLLWDFYDTPGWPARYLFDQRLVLFEYHHGEGAYAETERAIQELVGVERDVLAPVRPEDDPEAQIVVPTPEQPGAYSGPYEAGGVWAVVSGAGTVTVNGEAHTVSAAGCRPLLQHPRHTAGVLDLQVGDGVTCHATAFTPGLA